jgi:hypothetical protein
MQIQIQIQIYCLSMKRHLLQPLTFYFLASLSRPLCISSYAGGGGPPASAKSPRSAADR